MNKKMQAYWAEHEEWIKERDEAVLTFDLSKFKAFYRKWQRKGIYTKPLPVDDLVVNIAIRQMALAIKDAPKDKVKEAKQWLVEHGCSADPWAK